MIQITCRNEKFLSIVSKIPLIKYLFVVKIFRIHEIIQAKNLDNTFRFFLVDNNISKQTTIDRFAEIDDVAINYLNFGSSNIIHDIGVSNGLTSLSFYRKLTNKKINFQFFISDKFSKIFYEGKFVTKIYDVNGNLLIAYLFNLVASKAKYFLLSNFLYFIIRKFYPRQKSKDKSVLLFSNELIPLLENGEINYIDYDVSKTKLTNKFTFVRCMNVLNLSYFSESQIKTALANILDLLIDNGILQIGRTAQSNINHVSFYKKSNGKFVLLENVNEGTELKKIIQYILLK